MRLADFILQDMDAIVAEWETFASTLRPAAEGMSGLALRDHAQQILEAVAKDIGTPQTRAEQSEKSMGRVSQVQGAPETAAQTHAVLRAKSGFDIVQLVSEYRALRASVLRLWLDSGPLDGPGADELIRFNEAIDQAIAESVGHFHVEVERTKNLLLGMLGHDMRSPLSTIITTASYLSALDAGEEISSAAARLIRSGESIQALLDDLVDFNRTMFGLGVKIVRSDVDLAAVVEDELEQLRGAHPNRPIELTVTGNTRGRWDAGRLQQLLRNLVSNAIQYGAPETSVRVALQGERADVRLEVENSGAAIDPSGVAEIFDPLKRIPTETDPQRPPRDGLGLGLFIVREIAKAHEGEVDLRSEHGDTTFTVRLPRR